MPWQTLEQSLRTIERLQRMLKPIIFKIKLFRLIRVCYSINGISSDGDKFDGWG